MVKNKKAGLLTSKFGKIILVLVVIVIIMVTFFPKILSGIDNILGIVGLRQICDASGLPASNYNERLDVAIHQEKIDEAKEIIIEFYNCFEDDFEELVFISERNSAYQIAEELCAQGYFKESKGVFNVIAITNVEGVASFIDTSFTHGEVREICSELKYIHYSNDFDLHRANMIFNKIEDYDFLVWNFVLAESIYSPGIMPKFLFNKYSESWLGSNEGIINPSLNIRRISEDRIENIYYHFILRKVKKYIDSESPDEFCVEIDEWWELFYDNSPENFQTFLSTNFNATDNPNCEKYNIGFWKYEGGKFIKLPPGRSTQVSRYTKFKCKIRSSWSNHDEACRVDCEVSSNPIQQRFGDETLSGEKCEPTPIPAQLTD